jgi:hypothetical protein
MPSRRFVRVRNLDKYQHYRDRRPPWVKLHQDLLEDYDFAALPDASKAHALALILLASRTDNVIPADPTWIGQKIGAKSRVDLDLLIGSGWLEFSDGLPEARAEWASRYVSAATREAVMERDGRQCRSCAATEDLEIDHITPISRGGSGGEDNLQVLCRTCNRRKRVSLGCADAEQVAPLNGEAVEQPVPRAGARSPSVSSLSLDFVLPPELDTPPFRLAWERRLKERGALAPSKRPTAEQLEAQLAKLVKLAAARGLDHAAACVERATEAGHQGVVFPEDFNGNGGLNGRAIRQGSRPAHPGSTPERIALLRERDRLALLPDDDAPRSAAG